jgi:ubiquinone biosynthesis protein UbiJ
MRHFLLDKLNQALTRYLLLDPESKKRLKKLENKIIAIELVNTKTTFPFFQCQLTENTLSLKIKNLSTPDIIIKGTPLSLLRLVITKDTAARKKFFSHDVIIQGDVELAQKIMDLFDQLEIDWEEYISHWIGDVPAHALWRIQKKIGGFSQKIRSTLRRNTNEYLHEEVNLFPPREALADFFDEIDGLRMDTDRLTAKVIALEKIFIKHPSPATLCVSTSPTRGEVKGCKIKRGEE